MGSAREPEDPGRDHVALDLRRAAHDRLGPRIEPGLPELPGHEPVRASHVHRELLEALVRLAAEHLLYGALGPRPTRPQEPREAAIADQPQQLDLDVRLREALADDGVAERAPVASRADQLAEASPDATLEREGPDRPAFVREDAHRDLPAGAAVAHEPVLAHLDAVEEHLGELRLAVHLPERPDRDAGAAHVDEQQREPRVLRGIRLGAAEEEAPVGDVGMARPDLLAVHDEGPAAPPGPRAERCEVGAGAGLGEALAPELTAGEERAEEAVALRGGAVVQDRGTDQVDGRRRRRPRRAP